MQYKNTKFNTKANEINENWQGQEQSSEIWNKMGFRYLYTLGFLKNSNFADPEQQNQDHSLYFVLQFLCLSLCKFASVGRQKLKPYTHYF